MNFVYDDGGRKDAGYKGNTKDCVCRAIAIATSKPYQEVYDEINFLSQRERLTKTKTSKSHSRTGVYKELIYKYMTHLGWKWVPTMFVGKGCQVHLKENELPMGRLVVSVSKHTVAVIDREIHDTYDCSRGGTRCVYGYYEKTDKTPNNISIIPSKTVVKRKKKYPNPRNTNKYDQQVSTKTEVVKIAKKHGIKLDDDGYQLWADAPDGYTFKGLNLHVVTASYNDGLTTKGQAWNMILSDIKNGIEKCDCEDCQKIK